MPQPDIMDSLIGFIQRQNVRVLGLRTEVLVTMLVRARSMPGRTITDAMIIAETVASDARPFATFDPGQCRYGIETREP